MSEIPPLGAEEMAAWRSFLRAHATLTRRLDRDLQDECQLSLAHYDVLVHLSEAPRRRLRMAELAERVLLSRSGLSRLVDRLCRDGLTRRDACPSDARGTFAVLTDAGLDRLRAAYPTHLRGVRAYAVDVLSREELRTLRRLLDQLAGA